MKKMRQLLKIVLISIVLCFSIVLVANAETEGIYTYSIENNEATIKDVDSSYRGDVVIPETLGGYPVVAIGRYAFANVSVKNVVIPYGVRAIKEYAFYSCWSLETVEIPESVTEIGNGVFVYSCLKEIIIPKSVKKISSYTFESCQMLKKVILPAELEKIDIGAFSSCGNLEVVHYLGSEDSWDELHSYNIGLGYEKVHYVAESTATKPTCKDVGYTAGIYCSVCKAWLTGHEEINKEQHKFTDYNYDNNATYGADGTETAYCDNGCGEKDTITVRGTKLELEDVKGVTIKQTSSSVILKWDSVEGATGYKIYSCEVDGRMISIAGNPISTTKTKREIKNLKSGTTYSYMIVPYVKLPNGNVLEKEPESYRDSIYSVTTKPGVTSEIKAIQTNSSVKLEWEKVSGATGYRVYIYNNGWKKIKDVTNTKYTISDLKAGEKYSFAIKAFINIEGKTIWAEQYTSIKTATRPRTSDNLYVYSYGDDYITLKWSKVSGATGYRVYQYVSGKWVVIKTTTSTSYKISGLSSGKKHIFAVKPYIKVESNIIWASSYNKITALTAPKEPVIRLASTAKGRATVAWRDVAGEDGYQVWYSTEKDEGFTKISNYDENIEKIYKKGLSSGKKYYFKVRAYAELNGKYIYSDFSEVKELKIK